MSAQAAVIQHTCAPAVKASAVLSMREDLRASLIGMGASDEEIDHSLHLASIVNHHVVTGASAISGLTAGKVVTVRLQRYSLYAALFTFQRLDEAHREVCPQCRELFEAEQAALQKESMAAFVITAPSVPPVVRPFYVNFSVAACAFVLTGFALFGAAFLAHVAALVFAATLLVVDVCRWHRGEQIRRRSGRHPSAQKGAAAAF